jgi:glycerophosphoryl diester phosphodiesterase
MRHPTTATAAQLALRKAHAGIVLPRVIGHRGAAAYAPENTLAGFRQAKALNCRWVEFDVRLTADGQPIVLHDNRLERTTDGRGKVSALSLATVRRHSAGAWFSSSFAAERVPMLQEALVLLAELGLGANVELKAVRGRETETGTVVADLLLRFWPSEVPQLQISSFQPAVLAAAGARAPAIARGILFRSIPRNWAAVAEGLGCTTIHAEHQRLSPAVVADIRAAGYTLLAYTVNDPTRAAALFACGVTSVFSDDPWHLRDAAALAGPPQPVAHDGEWAGMLRRGPAS